MSSSASETCTHLDTRRDVAPSDDGCHECLESGSRWVHLRMCQSCGHIGCCDSSPNRHATAHNAESTHPLVQSFEPREEWIYCYPDDVAFELDSSAPSPSHP